LFHDKKPKRKFISNPTSEVIRFFTLKKVINKDAKSTSGEKGIKHGKFKEIEVEKSKVVKEAKEVCSFSSTFLNLFEKLQSHSCT
jgi:hypothetical protein